MKVNHYDLFAGIGGFSLALDTIFNEEKIEHIFCEWEAFPTAVLRKHWPNATYYGDIHDLVADTKCKRRKGKLRGTERQHRLRDRSRGDKDFTILTGGFPCQPFSHAGRRKGTEDDRYLWPPMFEVIRNVRPDWVIAENVRGLVTWNDGMVLETVCTDLESEGYEVQPLIIPAVAIGAPHRRDRVWIVAHTFNGRQRGAHRKGSKTSGSVPTKHWTEDGATRQSERADSDGKTSRSFADTRSEKPRGLPYFTREENRKVGQRNWDEDWREVALATCHDGVDDGLPRRMGDLTISGARYRKEALKAYGNAIVPQVAMEIFRGIKNTQQ